MNTRIIISYDGTENDHDALVLGRMLADAGGTMSLAYVRHTQELEQRREQLAQDEAEQLLARGAEWLGLPNLDRHVVLSASTADGLRALAEQEAAGVVVVGSDVHTAPGTVSPQRTAQRLLEGAPFALAIAAARLRDRADAAIEWVALPGGEIDPAARATAEALAASAGSHLATPHDEGIDVLVIGSAPGSQPGHIAVSSAMSYLIETARSSVLVIPRGHAVTFGASVRAAVLQPQS